MRTAGVDVDDARYDEDESMLYAELLSNVPPNMLWVVRILRRCRQ
jgi:hypothetical protein